MISHHRTGVSSIFFAHRPSLVCRLKYENCDPIYRGRGSFHANEGADALIEAKTDHRTDRLDNPMSAPPREKEVAFGGFEAERARLGRDIPA